MIGRLLSSRSGYNGYPSNVYIYVICYFWWKYFSLIKWLSFREKNRCSFDSTFCLIVYKHTYTQIDTYKSSTLHYHNFFLFFLDYVLMMMMMIVVAMIILMMMIMVMMVMMHQYARASLYHHWVSIYKRQ